MLAGLVARVGTRFNVARLGLGARWTLLQWIGASTFLSVRHRADKQ